VVRLGAGDRDAAGELFDARYPRLVGWIRRLVSDDDTAHEIASEAFTRLLARWTALATTCM
jgi:RNA polymerase sigma-70 factor, ECF subfamily